MPVDGQNAPVTVWVATDESLGTSWTAVAFDDTAWLSGTGGVGFERGSGDGYRPLMGIDLLSDTIPADQRIDANGDGVNETDSAYLRYAFHIDDPAVIASLILGMKYDDGYIAYLNGTEVARKNAPAGAGWDATATDSHSDTQAVEFENVDISGDKNLLVAGKNVLAIHGLNQSPTNSDMILVPRLADEGAGNDAAVGIPPAQSAAPPLAFGEIETAAPPAEQYVAIENPGALSVDLSGWSVAGAIVHAFKPGTVIPAGDRLHLSPDVGAFRGRLTSPKGGEARFVQGNYSGSLSAGAELRLVAPDNSIAATATVGSNPGVTFASWIATRIPGGGADADPDANPDRDGDTNFSEYAFATDPATPTQIALEISLAVLGGERRVTLVSTRQQSAADLDYRVTSSNSLQSGWTLEPTEPVSRELLPGGAVRVTERLIRPAIAGAPLYLRVEAASTAAP